MNSPIDDFTKEVVCTYRGETYSVRDNGAVKRHPRKEGRKRPHDDIWTFGKVNTQKGYLVIASVQVHRIVATAFHGAAPTEQHVVDHINTNKQDNRPENLRWVTRLENIILNPITRKRIESLTGRPIDYVLQHIEILHEVTPSLDFTWMRTVTKEESQTCYENLLRWAQQDDVSPSERRGTIGERVYQKRYFAEKKQDASFDGNQETVVRDIRCRGKRKSDGGIYRSLTPNAMVRGNMIP